ncbi:cytochrome c family protein [Corallococcus sp. bb12-1]|uniref:cytochrome c family protein n=1 Tax=Corallococcus sp. bb12-1 TaxID=2996784 RepID=UPI002271E16E|nr:cytochrome c family protein [Corallococcus sp. bb12-1]MCY1042474.1 cytochrome c family protein [Corallococcus sp. bb12-1]
MRAYVLAVLVGALLSGCRRQESRPQEGASPTPQATSPTPAASPPGAVLFISADTRGYLGPCGCSENMRGGIGRAAFQVQEARRGGQPVLYVDGGNSLFGETHLKPDQVPQEERKAKALADALRTMGLAVRATGELDDTRGPDFRRSLGLPEVASGGVKLLDAGARKVAVVAAASGEALVQASQQARAQGADFVVGLLDQPLEAAQAAAALPGLAANLVVATHSAGEFSAEENRLVRSDVPVVAVQSKGRSLLRVDLTYAAQKGPFALQRSQGDVDREVAALEQRIALLDKDINLPGVDPKLKALKQGKRDELSARKQGLLTAPPAPATDVNGFALRFLPLESNLASAKDTQALVTAYDVDVGKLNLAWAKEHGQDCPLPAKGQAGFVGSAACADCHAEATTVWEASKHHHAWETLEAVGKQHHLNCIGCHVTGWQQPGGVCRLDKVAGREDVGCESCHGPGSKHVDAPSPETIVGKPGQAVCVTCHNPENSPHFDFATYLPRILAPGHGRPVKSEQAGEPPAK